jgi:membrane dipeptidase
MKVPVFDGHNEALLAAFGGRLENGVAQDLLVRHDRGHFDLVRAQEGGFADGFFAVFVPSPPDMPITGGSDLIMDEGSYVAVLHGRGYDEPALRNLGYENWLRVLASTGRA